MKKFLIKLLKLISGFYILLWGIQFVLDNGLKHNKKDLFYEWHKIYEGEINADVVFLGSSRTVKHYSPKVFDNALNINSYNLGINGTAYDLQKLRWNAYLEHNKAPKIIVQNVDITSLGNTKKLINKEQYFPYYSLKNYKYLKAADSTITLEYTLPMYKYRSFFKLGKDVADGYLGTNSKSILFKGFEGREEDWDNQFEKQIKQDDGRLFDFSGLDIDNRLKVFNDLLSELKKSEAIIFLVWAPEYHERIRLEGETLLKLKDKYEEIAKANSNVYFLDFTKDSLCNSKDYFYNSYHLNKKGAEIFSLKVADSIKKYQKLNKYFGS